MIIKKNYIAERVPTERLGQSEGEVEKQDDVSAEREGDPFRLFWRLFPLLNSH